MRIWGLCTPRSGVEWKWLCWASYTLRLHRGLFCRVKLPTAMRRSMKAAGDGKGGRRDLRWSRPTVPQPPAWGSIAVSMLLPLPGHGASTVTHRWYFWLTGLSSWGTSETTISAPAMSCRGLSWAVSWGPLCTELPHAQPQLPDSSSSGPALLPGLPLWRGIPLPKPRVVLHVHASSLALRPRVRWDIKAHWSSSPALWPVFYHACVAWSVPRPLQPPQHSGGFQPTQPPAPSPGTSWEALYAVGQNGTSDHLSNWREQLSSGRDDLRHCAWSCFLLNQLRDFISSSVRFSSVNKCNRCLI